MKKLWQLVDMTRHEWRGYMKELYDDGYKDCEHDEDLCPFLHAVAAFVSNERNNHLLQHVLDNPKDYPFTTSDDFFHMMEIAEKYNAIYRQWVLKQVEGAHYEEQGLLYKGTTNSMAETSS